MLLVFEKNIKGQPNERLAFCGNRVISVINKIVYADSTYNISYGETAFGMKVAKWLTPFGDVSLLTHPLMNDNPVWRNEFYMYHPGAIKLRPLRDTHTDNDDKDGSRQGRDADRGTITTELSCEYQGEITGGILTGILTADV